MHPTMASGGDELVLALLISTLGSGWRALPKRQNHMSGMIAYCGLVCRTCPIYLATRMENREEQLRMRAEIAQLCKERYGMKYEPEDITDCDGCLTEGGRLFPACKDCSIRNCARRMGFKNCAHCSKYACEILEAFLGTEPDAKTRLDELRRNIQ